MIALLMALLQTASGTDWRDARTPAGWTWLGESGPERDLIFARPGPRPTRLWIRVEREKQSVDGFTSTMTLIEADCVEQSYKQLQSTGYSEANLEGRSSPLPIYPSQYAGPGTTGEVYVNLVCEGTLPK